MSFIFFTFLFTLKIIKMRDNITLDVIHYPMSVVEIYITPDLQNIVEVCSKINYREGRQHQWVEYTYPTIDYLKNPQSGGTETCRKIETILLDRLRKEKNKEDVYRIH
jgi:hypothetical protein